MESLATQFGTNCKQEERLENIGDDICGVNER